MRYLCLAFLVGCGPSFAGRFSGVLITKSVCTGGPRADGSMGVSWDLSEAAGVLSIQPTKPTTCGMLKADIAGNSATVRQIICTPGVVDGMTDRETVTGGTLTTQQSAIAVTLKSTHVIGDSTVEQCDAVSTGTLGRE